MKDAPERIFLQTWEGDGHPAGWTWCADRIDATDCDEKDVEYVRADLFAALEAKLDRLREILDEWCVCEEGRPCRFCAALREVSDGA